MLIKSYFLKRKIIDYLALVMKYRQQGKEYQVLIHGGRNILSESDNLGAFTLLYEVLLEKYPEILPDFLRLDDDGEDGDESGPFQLSHR